MEISVLLEPTARGFRASTQCPVPLAAEGETEAGAMAALSGELGRRLQGGGQLRTLCVPDLVALVEIGDRMRANPLFPDFLATIEEYRKVHNAVPNAD